MMEIDKEYTLPELPEVETVKRGLEQSVLNKEISRVALNRPDLRFKIPESLRYISGRHFVRFRRRAKYILADLDDKSVVLIHLGMSGRWTIFSGKDTNGAGLSLPRQTNGGTLGPFAHATGFSGRHDHVEIHFTDGSAMVYTDPRRFGFIDHFQASGEAEHPRLKPLGPEPLTGWTSEAFAARLRDCQKAIKTALLDQKFVVGVGNIYACEALFRSKINPRLPANRLVQKNGAPRRRLVALVDAARTVLQEAIAAGGSSLNDFAHTDGNLGYFSHQFDVYGREGEACKAAGCDGTIKRINQQGRSTFYCPRCQK